jgi:kinesin family protein 2/24
VPATQQVVDKQNSALLLDLSSPDQETLFISIMETFFQENRDSYIEQVATFQTSQDQAKFAGCESDEGDTSIGVRVRPLLPYEIEGSEVVGISVRPEASYVDVHELRRKVNGQSALNVTGFFPVLK